MNKSIIFLDHDSVICLSTEWGGRFKKKGRGEPRKYGLTDPSLRFDNFNKKAVKVLNDILLRTDAEIVVSSDWRFDATLEEMQYFYEKQGVIKVPIGYTTNIISGDLLFFEPETDLEETRSYEIQAWLGENPLVKNWVAIDDLDMSERYDSGKYQWGLSNFILTKMNNEGIKQSGIKEKILKYL